MLAEKQFHITDMVGCVYTVDKKDMSGGAACAVSPLHTSN